ncbi:MAG: molybdate ABC transporter substrate-binding protein [Desulfobacca sp.]|nr:molybdate ABC transporter substrate-binding protein [Desulfobacca sp.]
MKTRLTILGLAICLVFPSLARAGDKLMVAVAANYMVPFQEIRELFVKKYHIEVEQTFASTGKFYAQIIHGAPYDLFLAADEQRPKLLFDQGLATEPFIYATGRLIVWTAKADLRQAKNWQDLIKSSAVQKIAIANIENAPYATAAKIALEKVGLWDSVQGKLVFAQDVAQVFQYAHTGAVDVGFCPLSVMGNDLGQSGFYLKVDQAPPIVQAACVIKNSKHREAAEELAAFLTSAEVMAIKQRIGYE